MRISDQSSFLCKEPATESEQGQSATQDTAEISADSGTLQEVKTIEKGKDKEEKDKEKAKDLDKEKGKEKETDKEKGKEKDPDRKGDTEKEKLKGLEGTNLDALLQRLPGCVSRDLIDQLTVIISLSDLCCLNFSLFYFPLFVIVHIYSEDYAFCFVFQVEFCYLNSKSNRKRLVRALFNVPRTSLELLPYYSRMVATLSTCMKDVSSMLLQLLEEEFNFLINKKV